MGCKIETALSSIPGEVMVKPWDYMWVLVAPQKLKVTNSTTGKRPLKYTLQLSELCEAAGLGTGASG